MDIQSNKRIAKHAIDATPRTYTKTITSYTILHVLEQHFSCTV